MTDYVLIGLNVFFGFGLLTCLARGLLFLFRFYRREKQRRFDARVDALNKTALRIIDLKSEFDRRASEEGLTDEEREQLWSGVSAEREKGAAAVRFHDHDMDRIELHINKALELALKVLENMPSTAAVTSSV